MAVGNVKIIVVPTLSATNIAGVDKDVNILQDPALTSEYINQNMPANHIVADIDYRGPRPIVVYRQTS
jgi:hypothetical protein|tara:strand:+ start:2760 stop:2963 length:204 start_codon:yes stop_codon:yes gene_type:complete